MFKLTDLDKKEELKKLLYHIHSVQHAFLKIWHNRSMDFPEPDSFKTFNDISKWGYDFHQQADEFLKNFDTENLGREIIVPWSERLEKHLGLKIINALL